MKAGGVAVVTSNLPLSAGYPKKRPCTSVISSGNGGSVGVVLGAFETEVLLGREDAPGLDVLVGVGVFVADDLLLTVGLLVAIAC